MPSEIKIISRFNLSNDDLNSLCLLYLPLIGSDSISLYLYMHSLLDRKELATKSFKLENILDSLGWRLKKFEEALNKLEGINLVTNYAKLESSILILLAPMTAKNFLYDSNLGMYLNAKIGEDLYQETIKHFGIASIDLAGYQNITKSFDEVFKSALAYKIEKPDVMLMGRKPNKGSILSNFDFDIDLFISKIAKSGESFAPDFKNKIISVAYTYGYNIEQMVNLYNDSITKLGEFSFDLLKKKAHTLYTYLTNDKSPTLEVKTDGFDIINYFNNTTALDLLNDITGGNFPKLFIKKVADIYDALNISRGIINVMITYVYREKNTIPAVSYFEKVAESWADKGINTTKQAIDFLNDGITPINQTKNSKNDGLEDWQREGIDNMWKEILANAKN